MNLSTQSKWSLHFVSWVTSVWSFAPGFSFRQRCYFTIPWRRNVVVQMARAEVLPSFLKVYFF